MYLIREISEGIQSGKNAFALSWNTNDRQFFYQMKIPPNALHNALAIYLNQKGYHCGLYSQGTGLQEITVPEVSVKGGNPFKSQSIQHLNQLTAIMRREEPRCALIVQYSDLLCPASEGSMFLQPEQQITLETLHRWGADDAIRRAQNLVILISYERDINSLLTHTGVYKPIQIPLPDTMTRLEFINFIHSTNQQKKQYASLEKGFHIEELSRVSNGLRLIDLEALFRGREIITRKDIQQLKSKTIQEMAGGLVEVFEPQYGFEDIAGLDSAKEYFQRLRTLWRQGSATLPSGILLVGTPGSGKSMLIGALAKTMDVPLLMLRNIFGPYVGQSEANLERVLRLVNDLSPCIVGIEEIDQGIGQRGIGTGGDSGTSNRMSQRLWEALGSGMNKGKTLWIGTTNRPDLLDTAMLDRFQVVIPFLHPTPSEVNGMFPFLAKQCGRVFDVTIDFKKAAEQSNIQLPTARSLSEIVSLASHYSDYETHSKDGIIKESHLFRAIEDYKMTYERTTHEYIALKCISMATFHSLLPWMSFSGMRKNAEIPTYLKGIVDLQTGKINEEQLSQRLNVLENARLTQRIKTV